MNGRLTNLLALCCLVVTPAQPLAAQGLFGSGRAADDDYREMTSSFLAELGIGAAAPAEPDPAFIDPDMRSMTDNVLTGLGITAGNAGKSQMVDQLSRRVAQAMAEGESNAYIEALVLAAADAGVVSVPAALTTSEGRLDVSTLRSTYQTETAVRGASTDRPVLAASIDPGTVRATSAAAIGDPTLEVVGGKQYYIVQSGDSLGGIAYRIYGRTSFYSRIFEANRDRLASPDRIAVGQRLLIPQG